MAIALRGQTTIFDGIEEMGLQTDLGGWHSNDPIFAELIAETRPELIIEVGSWKGASAIHMASITAPGTLIFCVDTWLGGIGLFREKALKRKHGYPELYFQFLHNVKAMGFQDRIVPIVATSRDGARLLAANTARANLIYIDGSHEYYDVIDDMANYWKLLNRGGVMFGDDLDPKFPGVARALAKFEEWTNRAAERRGRFWILRRPGLHQFRRECRRLNAIGCV